MRRAAERPKEEGVAIQRGLDQALELGGQLAGLCQLQVVFLVHRLAARAAGAVHPEASAAQSFCRKNATSSAVRTSWMCRNMEPL